MYPQAWSMQFWGLFKTCVQDARSVSIRFGDNLLSIPLYGSGRYMGHGCFSDEENIPIFYIRSKTLQAFASATFEISTVCPGAETKIVSSSPRRCGSGILRCEQNGRSGG
jgi:hypothetical protein